MRLNRSIRNRGRRKKKGTEDLDITSLLDILTILLVFLLQNFNSSGVVVNVPKGISLPQSKSQSLNTFGVIIQVSPSQILVDDKLILDSESLPDRVYDQGGKRIIPLYDTLVQKRQEVEQLSKRSLKAEKFTGVANLVVDKTLKYNYLKKLMYTCAEAGYKTYKFVVLGADN